MKKMLYCVAMVIAALSLTGCGSKPKIPANTVAAWYVDLEKCLENGNDIVELVIDNLPKGLKSKAQESYDEGLKQFEKNLAPYNFKWMAATFGLDGKGHECNAVVVRCDYLEKNEDGKNLPQLIEDFTGGKCTTKFSTDVICTRMPALGFVYMAFVDEEYIIVTESEDWLEKMVLLYADGKGETSDSFGDLTDLGSDTVARIQTADVKTIVDILGVKNQLVSFGEQCDDEDLVEDILDIGNVTLDLNVSDDVLGVSLTVEAGSKELAKAVEGAFNVLVVANRLGADSVAMAGTYGKLLPSSIQYEVRGFFDLLKSDLLKELAAMLRKGLEVDRSGSTVKVTYEIDTEDLVELIVPPLAEIADKSL